jgi:hypothetical protein
MATWVVVATLEPSGFSPDLTQMELRELNLTKLELHGHGFCKEQQMFQTFQTNSFFGVKTSNFPKIFSDFASAYSFL